MRLTTETEIAETREEYEAAWSSLEIFQCALPEAVTELARQIEISAEVRRHVGHLPEPLLGRGLNALFAALFEKCPPLAVTRDSLRDIGTEKPAAGLSRSGHAALDAEHFAAQFGRVLQLFETHGIAWRRYGRRGLEVVTTDEFNERLFRLESRARLQWDELNYLRLHDIPHLICLAQNDILRATDLALNWQTSSLTLDDNWNTGGYRVGQWRAVLRRLIGATLASLLVVPTKTTLLQPFDLSKLPQLAAAAGVSSEVYRRVLDDLTLSPRGGSFNLAATPFIPVGNDLLITIPSLMLLRRADVLLLRRWSEGAPSRFDH